MVPNACTKGNSKHFAASVSLNVLSTTPAKAWVDGSKPIAVARPMARRKGAASTAKPGRPVAKERKKGRRKEKRKEVWVGGECSKCWNAVVIVLGSRRL